ncbi:hypothetical protein BCR44DRAFT_1255072 [Catenaria anguillulae PL171]|uniref:Uncharacterized protein n=1 Tax=Catenaria anguillulae PL171 TaxID=765915 RepID=A0A1Y2HEH9_9FUNG|nr:hypothetical protein BCR44DRAFT_1255072 [Catenaria anguillulae PL171]
MDRAAVSCLGRGAISGRVGQGRHVCEDWVRLQSVCRAEKGLWGLEGSIMICYGLTSCAWIVAQKDRDQHRVGDTSPQGPRTGSRNQPENEEKKNQFIKNGE